MKVLIVEDSRLARNELKTLLKEHDEIKIIGEAASPDKAVEFLENNEVDLLFLDINMPGKNGFELLEMLEITPYVIFTTAYDEYAIKSFEYNALDYLLKPINRERLGQAIEKALTQFEKDEKLLDKKKNRGLDKVFIKDGDKCWLIKLTEVRYFQNEGNYTRLFFEKNKPLIYKSLNQLETKLDPTTFFRVNRQQIINLNFIRSVESWFNGTLKLTLSCSTEIKVSRRNTVRLRKQLSI